VQVKPNQLKMKNTLFVSLLALTLVFSTACSGGDDEATDTSTDGEVSEGGTDSPSTPTTY
jgi:hypothetical protein